MTTSPPPSRYKVIEKGGRLVTIDTWASGKANTKTTADFLKPPPARVIGGIKAAPAPVARLNEQAIQRQPTPTTAPLGSFTFSTHASYDNNGPRGVLVSVPAVMWWVITHHFRVIIFAVLGALVFSWLIWLTPLLLFPAIRRAALSPFRSSLTKMFDSLDQPPI
jgi:hypothetical protein